MNCDDRNTKQNGLLLYHHPYSYYSQKVLMALYEKELPFNEYVINLVKNEQYESWFLDLNPRGEFPVLCDEGKIIPSSVKIIDYLEDNFQNDGRLMSIDQSHQIRQKVTFYRCQLEQIQSGILTLGSFYHEDFVDRPKVPFIKPVRNAMKNAENNRVVFLTEQMENHPRYRHIFQAKIRNSQKRHEIITSREEFIHQLHLIDSVLDKIEEELASHDKSGDQWLCCKSFTVADINLTVLLERLNILGLEKSFWGAGKRPCIEDYYRRVQSRESYQKTMPNIVTHLRLISQGHRRYVLSASMIASSLLLFSGWWLVRKIIH